MDKKQIEEGIKLIDSHFKGEGISRRDAIKLFGVGGFAALMGSIATPTEVRADSSIKAKIVIIGGGMAGIATASRLVRYLDNPNITIIEPNEISASYQAGQTLIAAGIWDIDDVKYNTSDYLPDDVTIIKQKAVEFHPDNNQLITANGKIISYDYLVVAAGLKLDFTQIEGLEINRTITSLGNNSEVSKIIGKNGLSSLYYQQGAVDTWSEMQKFIEDAKSGKKVKAIFTHPNTEIKSAETPKNIMYLTDARLREENAKENADLHLYSNSTNMFDIKDYDEAIIKQFQKRDMKWSYKHNLIKVDSVKKIAIFDKHCTEKGEYDEDLKSYEIIQRHENIEVPYDFMHITPPMIAAEEIASSPIGSPRGWIPVNKETLQHIKYANIFSLGDIADIPMGKTGGSVRRQYKVLVDNLISLMEGKEISAKYDGYTVSPIITTIGTVMLAEFNWESKKLKSGANASSFPLDPLQERWIWWLLQVYAIKPMTQYGLLSGRV